MPSSRTSSPSWSRNLRTDKPHDHLGEFPGSRSKRVQIGAQVVSSLIQRGQDFQVHLPSLKGVFDLEAELGLTHANDESKIDRDDCSEAGRTALECLQEYSAERIFVSFKRFQVLDF